MSRTNVNAMATLYFLHRLVDVFKFYFEARTLRSCAKSKSTPRPRRDLAPRGAALTASHFRAQELDEESLRDNFVIGACADNPRCCRHRARLTALTQCTSCSTR